MVKTPPFHGGITRSNRVRVTNFQLAQKMRKFFGRIAQLVRALASHARGLGFESRCVHQAKTRMGAGISSIPCGCFLVLCQKSGQPQMEAVKESGIRVTPNYWLYNKCWGAENRALKKE